MTHHYSGTMDFDGYIDKIGAFGPLQRIYFVLISLADLFGSFGMMITVFIGSTPRWHCDRFDGNMTSFHGMNATSTLNDSLFKCEDNGRKCVDFHFIDEFTSVVSEFNLVCGSSFIIGTVRTIQMFGVWFGAVIASQLSDVIGRKRTFYGIFMIEMVGGVAASFSPNWQVYAMCRFLVGAGFGGVTSVGCVYPMEFVGRRWRTLVGTIGFWAVGVMLLALLGYFIRDWRHLLLATTISSLPLFLSYFYVPESPRWLLQKGRYAEAEAILVKIAKRNGKEKVEFAELRKCVKEESSEEKPRMYSYLDLFKRRKTLVTTMIMVAVWFDIVICYYIMTYNMGNLAGNRYMNMFLMGITEYPAMACTFFLGNWIGRRYTYGIYAIITVGCCVVVIVSHYTSLLSSSPVLTTIMSQVARACVSGGMSTLMFYTPELFPTVIRNLGLGAAYFSGRLAGMIAPQIVFLGTLVYGLIPYIVVLVLTITTSPLLFVLPETNGKPIDDTLPQKPKGSKDNNTTKTPDSLPNNKGKADTQTNIV